MKSKKEENGELYFTMRKVEGKTFATLLQETSNNRTIAKKNAYRFFLKSVMLWPIPTPNPSYIEISNQKISWWGNSEKSMSWIGESLKS
jgi:hypothetical protein